MSTGSDGFALEIFQFLTSLKIEATLPVDFEVLDPYSNPEVRRVVKEFTTRYYGGDHKRVSIWGINPGRHGGGITGLSFTDPFAVRELLGIETTLHGKRELSAQFICKVIDAYGGPQSFYHDFYLSALSPLGFVKNGKNINFYDDAAFASELEPQIIAWMKEQIRAGLRDDVCIVLGTGKMSTVVERRLKSHLPFTTIEYLEHPRFIMQYRRRSHEAYVDRYIKILRRIIQQNS